MDSEYICERFLHAGFAIAEDPQDADIVVVNTCDFLRSAVEESIKAILELVDEGKDVICAGCLVSRYKKELLKELTGVRLFAGPGTYDTLPDVLDDLNDRYMAPYFGQVVSRSFISTGSSAYLKVCEGCSNHCNYCLIPSLRGELISKPVEIIEKEIKHLADSGVKEIVLIGQDLGSYGKDLGNPVGLVELLNRIAGIGGPEWIRIMYVHPASISDELIDIIRDNPRICPYIDMPIQHISDNVLKAMARKGGRPAVESAIEKIVDKGISIRSTVMVGHPGEDEHAFYELEEFISKGYIDHLGVFEFSPEPGTISYSMKPQLPGPVEGRRKHRIMSIQQEISRNRLKSFVGQKIKVLLMGYHSETDLLLEGRAVFQAPDVDGCVIINQGDAPFGSFCNVEITDSLDYDLIGRIV
ncbi:MAG: 30S ribosomal protein S12 methylthiotransferase RimO [Deltaproteobacteria bacterium]|nr:30S ribosomal protein S12 methylthiotransferase RimO [Deltaproteobacteria bacterium]